MSSVWIFVGLVSAMAVRLTVDNISQYIRNRSVVRPAPAIAFWNVFLLLLLVEMWIATLNALGDDESDNTYSALIFILLPIAVTLMAYLVQPPWKQEGPDATDATQAGDLQRYFDRNRYYFFGTLLLLPVLSALREVISGDLLVDLDLGFRAVVAVGAVIGLMLRRPRSDLALAIVMIVVIVVYTLAVFPVLTNSMPFEIEF